MERPDLIYNYYFPYYTQSCMGEKKYFYNVETVIHLSDNRGILLNISYKRRKPYKVKVQELNDPHVLFDYREKRELIHYTTFAKEVAKLFNLLSSAVRQLSSEKAYKKVLIFTSYIKHNGNIEIELGFRDIRVTFDSFNYKIEAGRIKRTVNTSLNTDDSEKNVLLKKLGEAVQAIDSQTKYIELDEEEFNDKLDRRWKYFIEYFKSPKFIKKSEYLPK